MPLCNYKWNDSMCDVYSTDDNIENNKEQEIKLISDFFKKINTDNILYSDLLPDIFKNILYRFNKIKNLKLIFSNLKK